MDFIKRKVRIYLRTEQVSRLFLALDVLCREKLRFLL
jgi:hypothetical protein